MRLPLLLLQVATTWLTLVELNCENLFDWRHDEGKNDIEFTEQGARRWTPARYWYKVKNIAQELVWCGGQDSIPDLMALCEVENDSVLHDLTHKTLFGTSMCDYLMTNSDDERGIDVALIYKRSSFRPYTHRSVRVPNIYNERALREILYIGGETVTGDTLHLLIVHAPSRYGGELESRPLRQLCVEAVLAVSDSIKSTSPEAKIIVTGDFNDYSSDASLKALSANGLTEIIPLQERKEYIRKHKPQVRGTYKYQGEWQSLDHVFVSPPLSPCIKSVRIGDAPFLLEEDSKFGGLKPFRTFHGYKYRRAGFSDHLPLIVKIKLQR